MVEASEAEIVVASEEAEGAAGASVALVAEVIITKS